MSITDSNPWRPLTKRHRRMRSAAPAASVLTIASVLAAGPALASTTITSEVSVSNVITDVSVSREVTVSFDYQANVDPSMWSTAGESPLTLSIDNASGANVFNELLRIRDAAGSWSGPVALEPGRYDLIIQGATYAPDCGDCGGFTLEYSGSFDVIEMPVPTSTPTATASADPALTPAPIVESTPQVPDALAATGSDATTTPAALIATVLLIIGAGAAALGSRRRRAFGVR